MTSKTPTKAYGHSEAALQKVIDMFSEGPPTNDQCNFIAYPNSRPDYEQNQRWVDRSCV